MEALTSGAWRRGRRQVWLGLATGFLLAAGCPGGGGMGAGETPDARAGRNGDAATEDTGRGAGGGGRDAGNAASRDGDTDPVPPNPGGDAGASHPSPVVLNEVVHRAVGGGPDWVELFNTGAVEVALEGYILRDENDLHSFVFPAGTRIPGRGFLLVQGKDGEGPLVADFGFGRQDAARLYDPGNRLVDVADWVAGDAPEGSSFGRFPDGEGDFFTLSPPTPGAPNAAPAGP